MSVDREEIIRRHFPLVRKLARRVQRVLPAADGDDLVGDGSVGLIRAVDTFDPTRGPAFEAYATRVVVGAMLNGLRRLDPVSERVRRTMREADRLRFVRAQREGRLPDLVMLEAEIPALRRAREVVRRCVPLSLDAPLPPDAGGLADPSADPAEGCAAAAVAQALRLQIVRLSPRERDVIALHYFRGQPLAAIGGRLHVSPQRVSQLHLRALRELRRTVGVAG